MRKKIFCLIMILFLNLAFIYSYHGDGGYHGNGGYHGFHGYEPFYPHYWRHYRDFPFYPYPSLIFIHTHEEFFHKMGNIYLDKDLSGDTADIDKITFRYGVDGNFNRVVERNIYFTDDGGDKVSKYVTEFLQKSGIPDSFPKFDNLKSYSIENNNLKLRFSNSNYCYREGSYYPEEYYSYNLNYSLIIPYTDSLKPQFEELVSKEYKNKIDAYIKNRKNMKAAGISIFITGWGLMGLLNVASLTTLYFWKNNALPFVVPGALGAAGIGAAVMSLSVGIPLWAASGAKKEFTINFNN